MTSFPGLGTVLNASTVVLGALVGMTIGHRLPAATRGVVTDCLGLVTLLMAALSATAVTDAAFADAVGGSAPVLIVLGSLLIGGVVGSLLRIEHRLEGLADHVQRIVARRLPGGRRASGPAGPGRGSVASDEPATERAPGAREVEASPRERFIEGWLTATLLFCVGPLTILGALNDGLGRGIDQLAVKSVLDGFAAMAFAASFGVGVLASAVSVVVIQGLLTVAGLVLGGVMPDAQISALTATGGLLLVGIAFRLLRIRDIPVGDLLPALVVAPLLTQLVATLA
ncbi:DUF554 domain-containing protein [Agilicoccus flavus]|uniref:DUF554 domain-containing protein n=1 Tax=Agilicoccus flavus TaxID=2775968 RepID=UPI001CF65786|nr:DUF554 domain-containing protein [Agilicoccus flavus]